MLFLNKTINQQEQSYLKHPTKIFKDQYLANQNYDKSKETSQLQEQTKVATQL